MPPVMSIISSEQVAQTAMMARLGMSDKELDDIKHDMTNILTMVEKLNNVDISNIEPIAHPYELAQRLRDDEVTETNQRKRFQDIAPDAKDGYFVVPVIIDDDGGATE